MSVACASFSRMEHNPCSRTLPLLNLNPAASTVKTYTTALAGVALATVVGRLLELHAPANSLMLYLLWVVYCAAKLGGRPSVTAAVLSIFCYDFAFVDPIGKLTLGLHEPGHLLTLLFFSAVAVLTARWTSQIRDLAEAQVELLEQAREKELFKEKERLQSALLNSVSHDLQTPISSIIGALDGLSDPGLDLDRETRKSLIETARWETNRLKHLVSNLLDLTRLESGPNLKRALCDPADLVGSSLSPLEAVYPGSRIVVKIDPDAPPVNADFVLIVQALVNLVENALKYSEGTVVVEFRWTSSEAVFDVSDTGPGIPEEDRERVFERFCRVGDTDKSGSGLGLAISRGLVEAHGGKLVALPAPAGGALLRLTLPRSEDV